MSEYQQLEYLLLADALLAQKALLVKYTRYQSLALTSQNKKLLDSYIKSTNKSISGIESSMKVLRKEEA